MKPPNRQLPDMLSADSVFMGTLTDGSDHAQIHEDAIRQMLDWHITATGSDRGQALMEYL